MQAIVIYLILIIFPNKYTSEVHYVDPHVLVKIHNILFYLAADGLVLPEERRHSMPIWNEWINVNIKRRAALAIYLLNWAYSVYHCLPSIMCGELAFIPAPTAKILWNARSETEWQVAYYQWLKDWSRCGYLQGEFLLVEEGAKLDERTEMWLEETDEFGMLFMGIRKYTCCVSMFLIATDFCSQCCEERACVPRNKCNVTIMMG